MVLALYFFAATATTPTALMTAARMMIAFTSSRMIAASGQPF
jgi:hypothetical protein